MRFFLLFSIFLIGISASSSLNVNAKNPNSIIDSLSKPGVLTAITKRALRSHDTTKNDNTDTGKTNEDRGWFDSLSYKLALKAGTDPTEIFQSIGALDDNPNLIKWLKYVVKYRAKKGGEYWFPDEKVLSLLKTAKPEEELASFFESLRQVPKTNSLAENMQAHMILTSSTGRQAMKEAWLQSQQTPKQVFKTLHLEDKLLDNNPLFIEWLRYVKMWGSSSDTTLDVVLKNKNYGAGAKLGTILQSIKGETSDLETLAKNLQAQLYQRLKLSPEAFERQLGVPVSIVASKLPKTDPRYGNLEAYTMHYADRKGGEVFERVKALLANDNLFDAVTVASKA